jgi:hypothetical protein
MGILKTEYQDDVKPPREVFRRWLRIPAAVSYSGFSRAFLYKLLTAGTIESHCVKEKVGSKKGIRIIDRESLDQYIIGHGKS